MSIQYGKDKELKNYIPTSADTYSTGLESGTSWKPNGIIVNPSDDNTKFIYSVYGTVKWKLLGFTFYSQAKHWEGEVLIK